MTHGEQQVKERHEAYLRSEVASLREQLRAMEDRVRAMEGRMLRVEVWVGMPEA